MKALILAAGRGERMRPLSDTTPKPLLHVKGVPLIEWHIHNLAKAGFREIIVNIDYLGEQILLALGDGSRWGVHIRYSDERQSGALETAGGIVKALPLLGEEPFLVVNGDIFTNYPFNADFDLKEKAAHLVLVPNPPHHPKGDFGLKNACASNKTQNMYTFAGIAYYHPQLFAGGKALKAPLAPLLRKAIEQNRVGAELFEGLWYDIGTPQRLKEINEKIYTAS